MSLGWGVAVLAVALVLIEVVNVFLVELWSDRVTDALRKRRAQRAARRYPWTKRTGT